MILLTFPLWIQIGPLNSGIVPIFKTETRKMGDGVSPASLFYKENKRLSGTTKQISASILFIEAWSNGHPLLQECLGNKFSPLKVERGKLGK